MKIHTVLAHLEPDERIRAYLHKPGELVLAIGGTVLVWIYERDTSEVYTEMCERFGLENETAHGDQIELGLRVGNEPDVEMVPLKVEA